MTIMDCTKDELKELEQSLLSDLESVRRVMALDKNPDLARVSELLRKAKQPVRSHSEVVLASTAPRKGPVKNPEIADVIMRVSTNFKLADVRASVARDFPDRVLRKFSIPAVLRNLIKKGKIKEVSPRQGRNGATYAKV